MIKFGFQVDHPRRLQEIYDLAGRVQLNMGGRHPDLVHESESVFTLRMEVCRAVDYFVRTNPVGAKQVAFEGCVDLEMALGLHDIVLRWL